MHDGQLNICNSDSHFYQISTERSIWQCKIQPINQQFVLDKSELHPWLLQIAEVHYS